MKINNKNNKTKQDKYHLRFTTVKEKLPRVIDRS